MKTTTNTLIAAALAVAVSGRRASTSTAWCARMGLRDRIAAALRPQMGETWQWLIEARPGESETAYARRAAAYAAARLGLEYDGAIVASVGCLVGDIGAARAAAAAIRWARNEGWIGDADDQAE